MKKRQIKHLLIQFACMCYGMIITFVMLNIFNTDITQQIPRLISGASFRAGSILYNNDPVVDYIVYLCSPYENEKQVDCVRYHVSPNYRYKIREKYPVIKSPVDFLEEGGICRDLAVTYAAIFMRLGWYNEFEFQIGHVYNKIYNDYMTCYLDNGKKSCFTVPPAIPSE